MIGYHSLGKQVLHGRDHVADACDATTAEKIAKALNLFASYPDDDLEPVAFIDTRPMTSGHAIRTEGDEHVCKCGVRWGLDEGPDHP